jgi:ABC-type sulfate transport system substrate-binding protein
MDKMVAYGPSVYDVVAVYEATAIAQAQNAVGRYGELHIYYPPAIVWSDHPFCILNADWVTQDKHQAAKLFIDYLTRQDAQQTALMRYGFRPVDPTVSLDQPGSPYQTFAANGLQSDLSKYPTVEVPAGNVLNTLLDFWTRTISR